MSFFNKQEDEFNNAKIILSTDDEQTKSESQRSSFFGTLKGYIHVNSNEEEPIDKEIKQTLLSKFQSFFVIEVNYTRFVICLLIGVACLFMGLMFLPMILIVPHKFVILMTIGNFMTIFSFIFFYGTNDYLQMLFNEYRKIYSCVFLISIFVGFFFLLKPTMYPIALICSGVQCIIMTIYLLTFIPGGNSGISMIMGLIKIPISNFFNRS